MKIGIGQNVAEFRIYTQYSQKTVPYTCSNDFCMSVGESPMVFRIVRWSFVIGISKRLESANLSHMILRSSRNTFFSVRYFVSSAFLILWRRYVIEPPKTSRDLFAEGVRRFAGLGGSAYVGHL